MKRILIVDDQPDIRELVRITLEIDGHDVHEAADGDSALAQASKLVPDLMLLDVMMPGQLDGLEVCRRVKRAGGALARVKVVMLSALDKQAGTGSGADGYLTKPFSPRELLAVVARMT